MVFSYERYERQQRRTGSSNASRSALTYWIPLIITVTAATAGAVAWVWNERSKDNGDDDEYEEYYDDYDQQTQTQNGPGYGPDAGQGPGSYAPPPSTYGAPPSMAGAPPPSEFQPSIPPTESGYGGTSIIPGSFARNEVEESIRFNDTTQQDQGYIAQMRGAIRRTPSPQKMLEGAGKRVAAGMAAVGKGLSSIGEGQAGDEGYEDHERWSEEAESRYGEGKERTAAEALVGAATAAGASASVASSRGADTVVAPAPALSSSGRKKRTVAVVVSAEGKDGTYGQDEGDSTYHIEHASLLSHLIGHVSPETVQLLILIYAPHLKSHPLSSTSDPSNTNPDDNDAENNLISSYTTPSSSSNGLYAALSSEASKLVAHPTHIMPFTTPTAHVHLLKHLAPNLVYMQESLCGSEGKGDVVSQISGWVGQCVVVVGAEGAGLVDTETEDEGPKSDREGEKKWWMDERRVGLGKGVEVVEGMRLGEDWSKRVETR